MLPSPSPRFRLGINTGFAVNRFSEPEEWTRIVGSTLGLRHVQLTADMLNPSLPDAVIRDHVGRIRDGCERHDVQVASTFTGAFTRVNHFSHPDPAVRAYWVEWFKRFIDIAVDLGARTLGSHFGIQTHADDADPVRRAERRAQNIDCWHQVGKHASLRGLDCLLWEPMSIRREYGHTIDATLELDEDVNRNAPIPFRLCLDVDHGDATSGKPADIDPYVWLKTFAARSPIVHLKQSSQDKSGHWPFTATQNERGIIRPQCVLDTLRAGGADDVLLLLEFSFRERDPVDRLTIDALRESVDYWRPFVPD